MSTSSFASPLFSASFLPSKMTREMILRPTESFFPPAGRGTFPPPRSRPNWKDKKADRRNVARRKSKRKAQQNQGYEPPRLRDLQFQNKLKASRFFPRRFKVPRVAPCAPFNTTSYIMRSKYSGGIASLVSPCPVTPAIIPTPVLSPAPPYREGLADEVNKEWGVNGYGSMKGLIRLRPHIDHDREDDESESDSDQISHVQSVQQLEQRLDHDLSRFEMIYPCSSSQNNGPNLLATHMDDQDSHIAHLEEENLILKERLYLMQQELDDLRRRMHMLEGGGSDEQPEVSSERSIGDASCACDTNFSRERIDG